MFYDFGGPPFKRAFRELHSIINEREKAMPVRSTFDAMHRGTDFSRALSHLRFGESGIRIAREGWNGKGMFLFLGSVDRIRGVGGLNKDDMPLSPPVEVIWMFTADETVIPWLASQTDMLADDWNTYYEFEEGQVRSSNPTAPAS